MKNEECILPPSGWRYWLRRAKGSSFFILHLKTKFYVQVKENIDFEVENW